MYHNKNLSSIINIKKALFVWAFVLIVMVAAAAGNAEQSPIITAVNESIDQVDALIARANESINRTNALNQSEANPQVKEDSSIDDTISIQSITFKKDTQIRDALQFLAAKYKKNIIPSSKVDGLITVTTLYNVTFKEALDAILGYGFKYERDANFIRIYTAEEYKKIKEDKSRMKYEVFTLYYVRAAEMRKLILPVLSDNGKIEVTSPALTGVPTGESISADSGGGDSMAMQDAIVIYDYPENIARAKEIITSVDIRPKQVLIEAAILSATLTEDMQFGIDWQTLKGTAITELENITHGVSDYFKSGGTSAKVESDLSGGLTIGFVRDDIAGFIRAIEEVSDVTLLANPKILAINKQLGQVYIGNKLGYREGDTFDAQGNRVEGAVKFLDTGTKLSFRPYIGNDGYIRMDIHPKDSSGRVTGGIPEETSAELVTNIIVKDGQTIVIGGLFRDKTTSVKTQVPMLGDLPVVGAIFRGTADQVVRQEVMVLLTPHIIEEPSQTEGYARAEDVSRARVGAKYGLQWLNRARLAEDRYVNAARYYIEGNVAAALREVKWALSIHPTYLEAIRLKEKIIGEIDPDNAAKMERIILGIVEREDSKKWRKR